jgi:hypothetical protein
MLCPYDDLMDLRMLLIPWMSVWKQTQQAPFAWHTCALLALTQLEAQGHCCSQGTCIQKRVHGTKCVNGVRYQGTDRVANIMYATSLAASRVRNPTMSHDARADPGFSHTPSTSRVDAVDLFPCVVF